MTPEELEKTSTDVINIIIEVIFLIDIFINFNTAYYSEDFKLIKNRHKIAKQYLRGQFIFDITAIIPIDFFFKSVKFETKVNWFVFAYLLKLVRFTHLFEMYNSITDHTHTNLIRKMLNMNTSTIRLFFFLLIFFLLTHFGACAWIIIAVVHQEYNAANQDENYSHWLDGFEEYANAEDHFDMYIVSFYWTITTITTVGYGDISANNRWERIFCSIMMVIGVIAFGFANGSFFSILSSNDLKKEAFDRKLDLLNHIKKTYHLPH